MLQGIITGNIGILGVDKDGSEWYRVYRWRAR